MRSRSCVLVLATLLSVATGCVGGPPVTGETTQQQGKADDDHGNGQGSHIVPGDERYSHYTYGEWQAKSWQWVFSMPKDHNPATDTADCSAGQSGDVWFLTGNHQEGQSIKDRTCTIKQGTALYLQMNLTVGDTSPGPCPNLVGGPDFATDEDGLIACVSQHAALTKVALEIDGEALAFDDKSPLYVRSPWFAYVVEKSNNTPIFGQPPGIYGAISEGIGALLKPLSRGNHIIHWKATDVPGYLQDITYRVAVE